MHAPHPAAGRRRRRRRAGGQCAGRRRDLPDLLPARAGLRRGAPRQPPRRRQGRPTPAARRQRHGRRRRRRPTPRPRAAAAAAAGLRARPPPNWPRRPACRRPNCRCCRAWARAAASSTSASSDLDTQLPLLAAAEAKLDAKIKALNGLKADIQGLLGQADQQRGRPRSTGWCSVYEGMKPQGRRRAHGAARRQRAPADRRQDEGARARRHPRPDAAGRRQEADREAGPAQPLQALAAAKTPAPRPPTRQPADAAGRRPTAGAGRAPTAGRGTPADAPSRPSRAAPSRSAGQAGRRRPPPRRAPAAAPGRGAAAAGQGRRAAAPTAAPRRAAAGAAAAPAGCQARLSACASALRVRRGGDRIAAMRRARRLRRTPPALQRRRAAARRARRPGRRTSRASSSAGAGGRASPAPRRPDPDPAASAATPTRTSSRLRVDPPRWLKTADEAPRRRRWSSRSPSPTTPTPRSGAADGATFVNVFPKPPPPRRRLRRRQTPRRRAAAAQSGPGRRRGAHAARGRTAGQVRAALRLGKPAGRGGVPPRRRGLGGVRRRRPGSTSPARRAASPQIRADRRPSSGADYHRPAHRRPPHGVPSFATAQRRRPGPSRWRPATQAAARRRCKIARDDADGPAALKAAVAGVDPGRSGSTDPAVGDTARVVTALGPGQGPAVAPRLRRAGAAALGAGPGGRADRRRPDGHHRRRHRPHRPPAGLALSPSRRPARPTRRASALPQAGGHAGADRLRRLAEDRRRRLPRPLRRAASAPPPTRPARARTRRHRPRAWRWPASWSARSCPSRPSACSNDCRAQAQPEPAGRRRVPRPARRRPGSWPAATRRPRPTSPSPVLADDPASALWRGYIAAKLGQWAEARAAVQPRARAAFTSSRRAGGPLRPRRRRGGAGARATCRAPRRAIQLRAATRPTTRRGRWPPGWSRPG